MVLVKNWKFFERFVSFFQHLLSRSMTWEYRGLQRVTRGYKALQGVTKGYRGLQGVTGGDKE